MKKSRLRGILYVLAGALLLWIGIGYLGARMMTGAKQKTYPDLTAIAGVPVQPVALTASDGVLIHAWLAKSDSSSRAVILLAGIGANSSHMTQRAGYYLRHGISVLLPDLRATGRSGGDVISFGWNERLDLLAAQRWLKANGFNEIGVHGCSLGAATIAYSLDSVSDYNFMVLESCYDNIDHAFAHRTFDSGFNRTLFWPLYYFTEKRTGAEADQLSPQNRMHRYRGPLLYLAGDSEKQIPVTETQDIFSRFASPAKTLHIFKGATHCDLYRYSGEEYEQVLAAFLQTLPAAHER